MTRRGSCWLLAPVSSGSNRGSSLAGSSFRRGPRWSSSLPTKQRRRSSSWGGTNEGGRYDLLICYTECLRYRRVDHTPDHRCPILPLFNHQRRDYFIAHCAFGRRLLFCSVGVTFFGWHCNCLSQFAISLLKSREKSRSQRPLKKPPSEGHESGSIPFEDHARSFARLGVKENSAAHRFNSANYRETNPKSIFWNPRRPKAATVVFDDHFEPPG